MQTSGSDLALIDYLRQRGALGKDETGAYRNLVNYRVRYSRACVLAGKPGRLSSTEAEEALRELRFGAESGELSGWAMRDPSLRRLVERSPGAVRRVSTLRPPLVEWARLDKPTVEAGHIVARFFLAGPALQSPAALDGLRVYVGVGPAASDRDKQDKDGKALWTWSLMRWTGRGEPRDFEGVTVQSHRYEASVTELPAENGALVRFAEGAMPWTYVGEAEYAGSPDPANGYVKPVRR